MLLRSTERGLYCEGGDFYVDPWQPVDRAVITHAHGDHARWGSRAYLGSREGERVLRTRLGPDARIQAVEFGEVREVNGVRVSLHPAGHILGSAQVRVEHRGEVWVVSGDYKTEADPTCTPFEPVRCHTFVTESTFGLPIYRWRPDREVFAEIDAWWRRNAREGRASLLFGYALGKAQRLLAGIDPGIGPIYTHGAVDRLNADYRDTGVALPPTRNPTMEPGARLERRDGGRSPVGARHAVDAALRQRVHRVRQRVDAGARPAPPPLGGPGLRPVRPRGLAVAPGRHPGDGGGVRVGDARLPRARGALAARARRAGPGRRQPLGRRERRGRRGGGGRRERAGRGRVSQIALRISHRRASTGHT
jgi:hypothetical protein